jgi:hypothetical protein
LRTQHRSEIEQIICYKINTNQFCESRKKRGKKMVWLCHNKKEKGAKNGSDKVAEVN